MASLKNLSWIIVIITFSTIHMTKGEVFTALSDMEGLLETEGILIHSLKRYLNFEEEKLSVLKKKLNEYEDEHSTAMNDITDYLANPINSFKLIKRLSVDWSQIEHAMSVDIGGPFVKNITNMKETLKFPTDEDLSGAASALVRLQDTYKLNTWEVADGKINGIKYSSDMTANDCFELGRQTYNLGDYEHTEIWMYEALNKYNIESNKTIPKNEILEYLAFSTYMMGNINNALKLTHELLDIVPDHARAKGNIPHYEKALKEKGETKENVPETTPTVPTERITYEELCRDEWELHPSVMKDLKCWYMNEPHPFLKIAPFKIEQHYQDPDIFVFHDIIFENEMNFIKTMAKPRFRRATVQDSQTGELVFAKYRISKSAWLKDNEGKIVKKISERVSQMTGLSMTTAEELQVVNYGIGGHYDPHFDFARKDEKSAFGGEHGNGNRIATVLFYMSDVPQGGATVFPEIGLSVRPKKGTGVFWMNLHKSGDGNYATRHAACPVLQGSKWVSNKWIHQVGQELLKPCDLEYQEEGIMRKFVPPIRKVENPMS